MASQPGDLRDMLNELFKNVRARYCCQCRECKVQEIKLRERERKES